MMKKKTLAGLALAALSLMACTKEEARSAVTADNNGTTEAPATVASNASLPATADSGGIAMTVYKDPNCGCCAKWVDHAKAHGFTVTTMDMPNLSMVKQKYGISPEIQSCHTAVVGDYAFEGHVPADVILKMLKEKPSISGLAVPGMPVGSPGMEGASKERYDILTFDRAGRTTVYAQR